MKRISKVLVAVILSVLLILQTSLVFAFTIGPVVNPDITKLPDVFFSRHEVIKAVPIYRTYNDYTSHNYTINQEEFLSWLSSDKDDGIAGYISPVPLPYTVPMWNMAMHSIEQYFVTSEENRDYVIGKYGYVDCGILGYVVPLSDKAHGSTDMHQWYKGDHDEGDFEYWDADHYYHNSVYYIGSPYTYEGAQFRVWSDAAVLQEINIISPNGGEVLTADTNVDIKWNTLIPGGEISLYYTLNPSDGWSKIAENIGNTGSYTWKVPNSITDKAIVEARWTYEGIDANCFDQSDKYFSIKAGTISPNNWVIAIKPLALDLVIAPSAPTNLSVSSSVLQKDPKLYWKDNASNETAYIVERKVSNGRYFSQLAKLDANITKYTDTTAEEGKLYYYRVKAVNDSLSSGYSNAVAGSVFELIEINAPDNNVLPVQDKISMLFTINKGIYMVNGESKTMDVSPIVINGRTLLPIRFVADPLGAVTEWKQDEQKVTVTLGSTKLELWINNNIALVNGKSTLIDPNNLEIKPIIVNNRTMLPMRFVAEKLGCEVEWLPENSQIQIDRLNPQPEPPNQ